MTSLAAALPLPLRRAVSPHTGIVASLEECLHLPSEPSLFRVTCEVARGAALLGASLDHVAGIGGAGVSRGEAAAAAVGEALERYSASYVPWERVEVATAAELEPDAVDPERFALFSERQHADERFPFVAFSRDVRLPWVDGWSILDGRRVWLPAELVFLADVAVDGCRRIGYATSSGAACAPTTAEALERGLAEVLERDAFMIVWANRLSLPLLDWRDDSRLSEADDRVFAVTGLPYSVVDLSPFHDLPSFLGIVRAPNARGGALGVGAGTAAAVPRAWWKALSEAFACRAAGAKLALLEPTRRFGPGAAAVSTFEDHIRYYADPARARATAFLDASRERTRAAAVPRLEGATPAERVGELARRVRRAGGEAYAVDVTAPDVRALGLVVTKVVAPELCALDVPHAARFLGGRRLYEAAAERGLRHERLAPHELNPEPHPFP